jgi:hypothetical protein
MSVDFGRRRCVRLFFPRLLLPLSGLFPLILVMHFSVLLWWVAPVGRVEQHHNDHALSYSLRLKI